MDAAQKKSNIEKAKILAQGNELIRYCEAEKLYPYPEGSNLTNWYAQCPNGGKHPIMISTISNEWGCGYCRKKGNLEDLKHFIKQSKYLRGGGQNLHL